MKYGSVHGMPSAALGRDRGWWKSSGTGRRSSLSLLRRRRYHLDSWPCPKPGSLCDFGVSLSWRLSLSLSPFGELHPHQHHSHLLVRPIQLGDWTWCDSMPLSSCLFTSFDHLPSRWMITFTPFCCEEQEQVTPFGEVWECRELSSPQVRLDRSSLVEFLRGP